MSLAERFLPDKELIFWEFNLNALITAIICYLQLSKVDESLEQLMEKFNILNIKCDVGKDKNTSVKTQNKHEVDARNIFKSTIIKFAQLQKVLKRYVLFY